jgi:hypothetical protein
MALRLMSVPLDLLLLLTAVDNMDNDVNVEAAGAGEMRIIPVDRNVGTGPPRLFKSPLSNHL